MRLISVCIEWPTGSEREEFEVDDDATDDEINEVARDVFGNHCSYGWSEVDQQAKPAGEPQP